MKIDIPTSISSLEDLAVLLRELRLYTRWFLHESIKKQVYAGSRAPIPELSSATKTLLQRLEKDGKLNSRGLENLVKTVESYQKNASPIVITLAAPATTGIKTIIVDWCRKNISGDVLVSFHHDSTILGGMVVRNKSRVVDLSFRRKLLESDTNFAEVLDRV